MSATQPFNLLGFLLKNSTHLSPPLAMGFAGRHTAAAALLAAVLAASVASSPVPCTPCTFTLTAVPGARLDAQPPRGVGRPTACGLLGDVVDGGLAVGAVCGRRHASGRCGDGLPCDAHDDCALGLFCSATTAVCAQGLFLFCKPWACCCLCVGGCGSGWVGCVVCMEEGDGETKRRGRMAGHVTVCRACLPSTML